MEMNYLIFSSSLLLCLSTAVSGIVLQSFSNPRGCPRRRALCPAKPLANNRLETAFRDVLCVLVIFRCFIRVSAGHFQFQLSFTAKRQPDTWDSCCPDSCWKTYVTLLLSAEAQQPAGSRGDLGGGGMRHSPLSPNGKVHQGLPVQRETAAHVTHVDDMQHYLMISKRQIFNDKGMNLIRCAV